MTTVEAAADTTVLDGHTRPIAVVAPAARTAARTAARLAASSVARTATTTKARPVRQPVARPRRVQTRSAMPASPSIRAVRIPSAVERRSAWERRYRLRLAMSDTAVVGFCSAVAAVLQVVAAGIPPTSATLSAAAWVAVVTIVIWSALLVVFQTRAPEIVGHGAREYRRLARVTASAFGVLAVGFVVLQWQGLRMQVLVALPLGILLLVWTRWLSRRWLVRQRATGHFVSRALVVGRRRDVEYVVRSVHRDDESGYRVVGVALDDDDADTVHVDGTDLLAIGSIEHVAVVAAQLGADAVIVASTPHDRPDYLKRLAWQLEGTASELVLSSPLTDVAGPRMTLRSVEGLPLVQVRIPTFDGGRFVVKRVVDALLAAAALLVVGLVTPFIAAAVKLDSPGPVFFRQERVGRDGRTFRMVKFRSMCLDAESRLAGLEAANDGSGPLFKLKSDPRVTRVGAFLRRYSLDELPQFVNVLRGEMSIVGPRPPLPQEARTYGASTTRRLFIRPGITGPWQIGGRSDLSWEDSLRLDLRYVENWSLTEDLLIMARTAKAMIRPSGAY